MVEVNSQNKVSLNSNEWKIRMEGRIMSESEEEILKPDTYQESKRFLNYFEKIRVEFQTGGVEDFYPTVEWVKAKSESGSAFDCFEISRTVTKD